MPTSRTIRNPRYEEPFSESRVGSMDNMNILSESENYKKNTFDNLQF